MIASTAHGQPASDDVVAEPTRYSDLMSAPVTAADITDRPYCVIGPVKKEVRKATVFSKASSPAKVRRELWESAEKKALTASSISSPEIAASPASAGAPRR